MEMAGKVRRITLLQGHPDSQGHYCHALAEHYVGGARAEEHHVEVIDISAMEIPFLRSKYDVRHGPPPECVAAVQTRLLASDHIVLLYPIWNGSAPARLRAFMEQVFRPSFTFPDADPDAVNSVVTALRARKALTGKTAHVITTMQMPAVVYRLMYRPHQEASALWLAGARPVRETPIGGVESKDAGNRERWLTRMTEFGALGM